MRGVLLLPSTAPPAASDTWAERLRAERASEAGRAALLEEAVRMGNEYAEMRGGVGVALGSAETLADLRAHGVRLVGLERGYDLAWTRAPPPPAWALVAGAELAGLAPRTREACQDLVSLPGGSFNLAVAVSLLLCEITRGPLPSSGP